MPGVTKRLAGLWQALDRFASGRWATPLIAGVALVQYAFVASAWPLAGGRDLGTYLRAAFELRSEEVVLPNAMLTRAPLTGIVSDALLSAGPIVAEAAMAGLYAVSIVCWWLVARRTGSLAGIVLAIALLAYPGYALLFHRLSSDSLYAAAFAVAALLAARAVSKPTPGRAAVLGGGLAMLVLVRPVSEVLIVLTPLLLFSTGAWRLRAGRLAAFALAAVLPLVAWAAHNEIRAHDFTIVRGGGQAVPLFRAFVVEGIVSPENGSATRELARIVARDLLPNEPYRSYGIDVDEFFSSRSSRMHEDLTGLSDRTWGWDNDYRHLGLVGREAVLKHPWTYAQGVARDTWRLLWWPLFLPVDSLGARTVEPSTVPGATRTRTIAQVADPLPLPTEGQPIPGAWQSGWLSTPDWSIREVWESPANRGIVFRDADDETHYRALDDRLTELFERFPDRGGNPGLASALNSASRWYPRAAVWLVLGLVAILVRRPRRIATPLVLAAGALLVTLGTSLAVPATAEYSVPVVPAFILLAVAGFLAPAREDARSERATGTRASGALAS